MNEFAIGTKVHNAMGWTGVIVKRPRNWTWKEPQGHPVVYVDWRERRAMMEGEGDLRRIIKDPVVSARAEDLTLVETV